MNSLDTRIEALIKQKLSEPLYIKIQQTADGKLKLEQIRFLRCEEVARLTGVETRTVRGWISKGLIPHYRLPGSSAVLLSLSDVIACIEGGERAA